MIARSPRFAHGCRWLLHSQANNCVIVNVAPMWHPCRANPIPSLDSVAALSSGQSLPNDFRRKRFAMRWIDRFCALLQQQYPAFPQVGEIFCKNRKSRTDAKWKVVVRHTTHKSLSRFQQYAHGSRRMPRCVNDLTWDPVFSQRQPFISQNHVCLGPGEPEHGFEWRQYRAHNMSPGCYS